MPAPPYQRPIRRIPPLLVDILHTIVPTGATSLSALRAFGENFDPGAILYVNHVPDAAFDDTSPGCRYQYRYSDGRGIELVRLVSIGSVVRVDLNSRLVRKEDRLAEQGFGCISREAAWLDRLSNDVTPRLHEHSVHGLLMSYEGEPVSPFNLPFDWRAQAETILSGLTAANCAHNDIKAENLMVAGGRLKLIDFGYSTEIGAPIPANWPDRLGEDHRLEIHRFDDRKAIYGALGQVEARVLAAAEGTAGALPRPPAPAAPPRQ